MIYIMSLGLNILDQLKDINKMIFLKKEAVKLTCLSPHCPEVIIRLEDIAKKQESDPLQAM